jgi:hypothetical protein
MASRTTKSERREQKKRRRMPVSGKHVFTLQQLMTRQSGTPSKGPGKRGKHGRQSVRGSHRVNKPSHGSH